MGKHCSRPRPLRHTWWQAGQQWAMPLRNPHSEHFGNLAPVKGPSQVRSIATGSGGVTTVPRDDPNFLQRKAYSKWQKGMKWQSASPGVAVLGVLLSHANVNIPTCNGETVSRFWCGLPVNCEGSIFLYNCFFYSSEWADSVSWWMGPGINTPALLSGHS